MITLNVKKATHAVKEYEIPTYYDVEIMDEDGVIMDTTITAQQALEIGHQLRLRFSPLVME
jgi:hypothetical protein